MLSVVFFPRPYQLALTILSLQALGYLYLLLRSQGLYRSHRLIYRYVRIIYLGFDHESQNWTIIDGRPLSRSNFTSIEFHVQPQKSEMSPSLFTLSPSSKLHCYALQTEVIPRDSHDLNNEKTKKYSLQGARTRGCDKIRTLPHEEAPQEVKK